MFNWNTDYRRARWCTLAAILFILTGCGTGSVIPLSHTMACGKLCRIRRLLGHGKGGYELEGACLF